MQNLFKKLKTTTMKKIVSVLFITTMFASKSSANNCFFTNLKSTLSYSSNVYGPQSVEVNTACNVSDNRTFSLPADATNISITVEAINFNLSLFYNLVLVNNNQVVSVSNTSPNANPFPKSAIGNQPQTLSVVWHLPISFFQSNSEITIQANGTASLTQCTFTKSMNSLPPAIILSDPIFTGNPCELGNNYIRINASGGGGTGTYNYVYSFNNVLYNGAAGCMCPTQNTKGIGNYSVTVTSAGLSRTKTYSISQADCQALALTSVVLNNAICTNNGSAKVVATGGTGTYTYVWKDASGNPINQTTATAIGLTGNKTYSCTVTSGAGIIPQTVSVTIPLSITALNLTTSSVNAFCTSSNGTATVNNVIGGTTPYSYVWTNALGAPINQTAATANGLTGNNNYTVNVKDVNGCEGTTNVTVSLTPCLPISLLTSPIIPAICTAANGSATVIATGGTNTYTYVWKDASGNPINQTTATATGLSGNTTYSCTVTSGIGITPQTISVTIPLSTTALNLTTSSVNEFCTSNNGTATVNNVIGGTTPYSYVWTNASGAPINQTAATATGLTGNVNYTVNVKDANGCVSTSNVTVGRTQCLIALTYSTVPVICPSTPGSATVSATGGTNAYTYVWKDASGNPINQTTATATGLTAGTTYNVTVTSGSAQQSIQVVMPPSSASALPITIKRKLRQTGIRLRTGAVDNNTIEVWTNTANLTSPNYTFLWSTGATAASIDLGYKMRLMSCFNCPPPPQALTTTYTVTVKNQIGCIGTASYVY
jgi:hypothetical protein